MLDRSVDTAALGAGGDDMSVWMLFMHASPVVKCVMIGLIICSIMVWAIIFDKYFAIRRINRAASKFEDQFWSGGNLDDLYEREGARPTHPMAAVFGAAMGEWRRSARIPGVDLLHGGVGDRIQRAIDITITREMDRMRRWVTFLATVGPIAPFVGLFGTVWGIMHSFSAIAAEHNTSLSVVAPGISEALFATVIGLFAAIPAYAAYNVVSSRLNLFEDRLDGFGAEFSAILSRQSEEETDWEE